MSENSNIQPDLQKDKKFQRDPHFISWQWPIVVLAIGCLLYYLIHISDHSLPKEVTINEAIENTHLFSSERSRNTLRKLTKLGPRLVGSIQNEVHAPALIEHEVQEAQLNAHSSQSILLQRQKGSGAYFLGFKLGFTNIYDNIQNVLVLLEGSERNHSILINCHYDTVPASEGASDDGITCAVMLELLRVLSMQTKRLKHNVIFLFNGAEETPLQGAHLFLKHEWAKKARIVLNLEAGGQGGREILFQSGPKNSWIFDYYAKYAPHPHGQILTEELFQNGFIPSDTDFRIFRDFGKMPGLDLAFGRNGYVYHTKYDTEEYIPLGSYQHLGDNLLELVKGLGNAPELYTMNASSMQENSGGQVVYYDYLGWFMIGYSFEVGITINILAVCLAIFSIVVFIGRLLQWSWLPKSGGILGEKFTEIRFYKGTANLDNSDDPSIGYVEIGNQNQNSSDAVRDLAENVTVDKQPHLKEVEVKSKSSHNLNTIGAVLKEIGISLAAWVIGILLAVSLVVAIGFLIDAAAPLAMPWYSNVWLIFPIYWCPSLVMYALIPHLVNKWRKEKRNLSIANTVYLNLITVQITWIVLLFLFTCLGIRSSSLFFLPVVCSAVANLVLHLSTLYINVHKWIWVYIAIHIPSLVFTLSITLLVYVLIIPISARSGPINCDVFVGLISSLLVFFVISFAIPLMGLVRKELPVLVILISFSVLMIIIALSSSIGFPYKAGPNSPAPQRYWIMHSDREFYNESQIIRRRETGYFILNLDRNSPRTVPLGGRSMISLKQDCEEEMNCGLPFFMTRMMSLSHTSSWIPAPPPHCPNKTELIFKSRCQANDPYSSKCSIELGLKGPDRLTLTFVPREGAELVSWSVPSPISPTTEWKGRPLYYLHIVRGEIISDYSITLEFEVTPEQKAGRPILDIGLAGNHAHHEGDRTKEFNDFLESFPDWTTMIGWISAYKLYII